MNEHDLNAIEQRAEVATPGPWKVFYECYGGYDCMSSAFTVRDPGGDLVADLDTGVSSYEQDAASEEPCRRNADFIAAARTDVPALVASLRAAWAERDEAVNAAHWLSLERERLQLAMDAAISEMPDSVYRRDLQAALTPPDAVGRAAEEQTT